MLELCCTSLSEAQLAQKYGIRRIELNSALELDGLSPYIDVVEAIKQNTDIKIIAMLRLRPGNFIYDKSEIAIMQKQLLNFIDHGVNGIAFGALNSDFSIDTSTTKRFVDIAHNNGISFVFHRAFDISCSINQIENLVKLGVDSLLTSGMQSTALKGIDNLKYMQHNYGKSIKLIAAAGINPKNIMQIKSCTGISRFHGSFSKQINTGTSNNNIEFAAYKHSDEQILSQIVSLLEP